MGREVRRVPKDWEHPKKDNGEYIPLFDGADYAAMVKAWDEGAAQWADGKKSDWNGGWVQLEENEKDMAFEELYGRRPDLDGYMPEWPEAQRTHLVMYEDTTEGTPISPAFETPGELAKWLADNKASAFGDMTATYEQWIGMCRTGSIHMPFCDP